MISEAVTVGEHTVRREAEDLFVYRFQGLTTREELAELVAPERRVWEGEGPAHMYTLTILGEAVTIPPGALTAAAKMNKGAPPRTIACVTPRFILRTSMDFLARMIRALGVDLEVRMFPDEASARAWLEDRRASRPSAPPDRISSSPGRRPSDPGSR